MDRVMSPIELIYVTFQIITISMPATTPSALFTRRVISTRCDGIAFAQRADPNDAAQSADTTRVAAAKPGFPITLHKASRRDAELNDGNEGGDP